MLRSLSQTEYRRASFELALAHTVVLIGGMLLAVQLRLQVALGQNLPPAYRAQPIALYILLALGVFMVHAFGLAVRESGFAQAIISNDHPYRKFLASLALSAGLILVLLPDISQLQVVYFFLFSTVLGMLCIALPFRVYVGKPGTNLLSDIRKIWQYRALLQIWLSFNIQTRYSQRILGILWIVIIPISTAVVLTIAFTQFMRVQLDVPFISFYLAALVPYNLFSNGILMSTVAIISRIGIMTQVYFPREILVLLVLGELLVDFVFTFLAMMLVNAFSGIWPNIYYLYLPMLSVILILMTLGLMLIVSSLTVLVRDIPQLIAVVMQLFFFLTPVIYPIETIPERLRFLFLLNPIASIVQAFREIIVFGRPPDWVSLHYPLVFAGAILVVGYATFKSIEDEMADLL